jgi:hypothetical protein
MVPPKPQVNQGYGYHQEPPKQAPPPKPKDMKLCNVCRQQKEKEEFDLITCGDQLNCSACSYCRKTNQEACVLCGRFYSDYEKQMFAFIL